MPEALRTSSVPEARSHFGRIQSGTIDAPTSSACVDVAAEQPFVVAQMGVKEAVGDGHEILFEEAKKGGQLLDVYGPFSLSPVLSPIERSNPLQLDCISRHFILNNRKSSCL